MPAILRNVAKNDTLESQRQKINLLASDLYGVLSGSAEISVSELQLSDGSRLNPSLNFTSNSLLGLYKSGNNKFSISSNGQTIASFSDSAYTLNKNLNIEKTSLSTAQLNITNRGSEYVSNTYNNVPLYGGSGSNAQATITVSEYIGNFTTFHNVNNYIDGSYTNVSLIGNTRFNGTIVTAGAGYVNGIYENVSLYNVPLDTFIVTTTANPGTPPPANVFVIDGVTQDTLSFVIGNTYRFDVSDSTNNGHPLNFSDSSNQSLSNTDFVIQRYSTEGTARSFVDVIIKPTATPQTIKYYCANHSGMGGNITIVSGTAGNYGSGGAARVEYTSGSLSSFRITTDGSGYASGDTITLAGGSSLPVVELSGGIGTTGTGAVVSFDIVTTDIASIGGIINAGSGYLPGFYTNVPFTGGAGNGKIGSITVSGDISITNTNNGNSVSGYTPGSYIATPLFNKPTNTYNLSVVQRQQLQYYYGQTLTASVVNNGNTSYDFTGDITGSNPTINLNKGDILTINVSSGGRPFAITSSTPYTSADLLTSPNVTGTNPVEFGTITLNTKDLSPGTYYYHCSIGIVAMTGQIIVSNYTGSSFAVGDTITGVTSGASGVVTYVDEISTTKRLRIATVTGGPFTAGEGISNGTVDGFLNSTNHQTTVNTYLFGSVENISLLKGNTYRFNASDVSNSTVLPYIVSPSFSTFNANQLSVITEGTPGTAGSFFDVVINPSCPGTAVQFIPLDTTGSTPLNLTPSLIPLSTGSTGQYTLGMEANAFVSGLGVIPSFQIRGSVGSNYKIGDILQLSPVRTGNNTFEATISGITYSGYISNVAITTTGTGYQDGDILSINDSNVGNVGGSGFQYRLTSVKEIDNFTFLSKGTNYSKNDLLTLPRIVSNISTTLDTASDEIIVSSTVGIYEGFILEKVSGAGDILSSTTVIDVIDSTTLQISQNPSASGSVILNFVPPYGRNSGFEYKISDIGIVESIVLTNNGSGYETGDILTADREDLSNYPGPYSSTNNLQVVVNGVTTENIISGNVTTGNLNAQSFTGTSSTFTTSNITTLTAPTINGNNISLSNITSSNNISLSTSQEINFDASRFNIGNTIDVIPSNGNILTSGSIECSSVNVNNVLNIGDTISSTGINDIILSPASLRVVKINSTTGLQIPAGSTAQRPQPGIVNNGSIRYNTDTNQYEGYSASSSSWSSLGGVRDLDGNTYILAEQFAGANDNTFYFFNDSDNTINLTPTLLDFKIVKTISSSNVSAPTYQTWAENTPVSLGAYLRFRNNIYVVSTAGITGDSTQPPTHLIGAQSNGSAILTWNSLAVDNLIFDGISEVKIGPFKNTPLVVSEELKLINNTISTLNNDLTIQPFTGKKTVINSTTSLVIPSGNTSERGIAAQGGIRYNSQLSSFEGYNGTNWTSLGGVKDVDGNTYIIPETSPGANENILYFYNDADNTLQLSKTALTFKTIDRINSDSNNLDVNVSTLSLNNDIATVTVNSSLTKLQTISNTLEFGISSGLNSDTILKLDDTGALSFNTNWGTGSPSYIKLLNNSLTEFELNDVKTISSVAVLTKGTTNSGAFTIFNPSLHAGAKIIIVADNSTTNDRELIEYTVVSKGTDIFHTEYGNVVTNSDLITTVFDFDASNNVRLTSTLSSNVSNGNVVNITTIITIIKK